MAENQKVTLRDVLDLYAKSLKGKDTGSGAQQAVLKFVNWCGADRAVSDLAPPEIGEYGEHTQGLGSNSQAPERIKEVRNFLSFAKKKGLTEQNLAPHLRIRKSKSRSRGDGAVKDRELTEFTPDGYKKLVVGLEKLKAERGPIAAEIKRAAADKDVRENAPLEAAREQLGLVEFRIREIEESLRAAVVIDPSRKRVGKKVGLGSVIRLEELASGRETKYTLVSQREASPMEGKISDVSPVGRTLLNRSAGQEIDVETPRGKLRYRIVKVS